MSSAEEFTIKEELIHAIPESMIMRAYIPINHALQESEDLYHWCQEDKLFLEAVGLDWNYVLEILVRAGCCRVAQARWMKERDTQQEAQKHWANVAPAAYERRDDILAAFRYAYAEDEDLLQKVKEIGEGHSNADLIQDLYDSSVFGKAYAEPLLTINFDLAELDEIATLADTLSDILGFANGTHEEFSSAKIYRDKAYTHLKEATNKVCNAGRYAFRKDKSRLTGYSSNYRRNHR